MDWNELFIRCFAVILLIPAIGAAVAHWRQQFARSMLWNGSVPLLVLCVSVFEMLMNRTQITPGGVLFAIPPVAGLAACAAGYLRHSRHPLLFWFPWVVNLAILACLFYLGFWFRISF